MPFLGRNVASRGAKDLDAAGYDSWCSIAHNKPNSRRKAQQIVRRFCLFRERTEPKFFVPCPFSMTKQQPHHFWQNRDLFDIWSDLVLTAVGARFPRVRLTFVYADCIDAQCSRRISYHANPHLRRRERCQRSSWSCLRWLHTRWRCSPGTMDAA